MYFDHYFIIQINATVIAGTIVLFTLANIMTKAKGETPFPRVVALVTVPFCISAIFAVFSAMLDGLDWIELFLHVVSLASMIVGFSYVIVLMISRSRDKFWR